MWLDSFRFLCFVLFFFIKKKKKDLPNRTEMLESRFLFKREIIPPLRCQLWALPVYLSCFISTFGFSWYFMVFKNGAC